MVSCTKERGGIYQGDGGDVGATGKILTKETWLSYYKFYSYENYSLQYTGGKCEGVKWVWSGNQLNNIVNFDYEGVGQIDEERIDMQYVYDGGKLIEIKFSDDDGTSAYLTYSGENLTEIYASYTGGWIRKTMTYSSDGHLIEMTAIENDGSNYRRSLTWSGDNVVSEQLFSNGSLYATGNYTYDNKKSAYTEMPKWYALVNLLDEMEFEMLSANNVILESWVFSDGSSYTYSYTYAYDGEWPVKRIETYNEDYIQTTFTTFYEYADGTGTSQVPTVYTLDANSNNLGYGYARGGGDYAAGSTAVLYAVGYSGYTFQQWSDGNTQNPRTVTVNSNATYTAQFGSTSGGGGSTLLSESFESGIPSSWVTVDADGDGYTWDASSNSIGTGQGYGGTECAASASYINAVGALTPDNYLVTPYVSIPGSGSTTLSWYVAAQDAGYAGEYYSVFVGYMNGNNFNITEALYSETVTAKNKVQGTWRKRSVNLDAYKGQSIRIAFRHWNCTDQFYLLIDDVEVVCNGKSVELPSEVKNNTSESKALVKKHPAEKHSHGLRHLYKGHFRDADDKK